MLTNHGEKRMRERVGVPKGCCEKVAEKAYAEGFTHADTTGSLKRYFDGLYLRERKASALRLYNYNVYIFRDRLLITVIPLPKEYYRAFEKMKRKRKEYLESLGMAVGSDIDLPEEYLED